MHSCKRCHRTVADKAVFSMTHNIVKGRQYHYYNKLCNTCKRFIYDNPRMTCKVPKGVRDITRYGIDKRDISLRIKEYFNDRTRLPK